MSWLHVSQKKHVLVLLLIDEGELASAWELAKTKLKRKHQCYVFMYLIYFFGIFSVLIILFLFVIYTIFIVIIIINLLVLLLKS